MTLLTPLALFFLVSVPLVIVLYLLKLRRVDKPISSTLLWRQSLEDLKANTPFQKLRSNLLLFLQLLILILLSLAIARPALRFTGLTERNLIVLLDNSASMGSVDIAPSRLGFAKQHIQNIIDNLSAGDSMMLIAFSKGSDALSPFTKDRRKLSQDLQWVEVTDQPTDMDEAFRIALARRRALRAILRYLFSQMAPFPNWNWIGNRMPRYDFYDVERVETMLELSASEHGETLNRKGNIKLPPPSKIHPRMTKISMWKFTRMKKIL